MHCCDTLYEPTEGQLEIQKVKFVNFRIPTPLGDCTSTSRYVRV